MVKTLSRDDIKRSVRDTIREYLGWCPIDELILTFTSYADQIEELRVCCLSNEAYDTLTSTWGKACTSAMSEVIGVSWYIQLIRKELEQEPRRVRSRILSDT